MEVRDIFALRKEGGKEEEAYRAISEIFAVHRGKHTNSCMFWCTSDLFRLRAKEKNAKEARRLLGQLVKLYPLLEDDDKRAARAVSRAALAMDKLVQEFNLVYFMPWFNQFTDEDWQPQTINGHKVPSLAQQVVNHLMRHVCERDAEYIDQVTGLFRIAMQKQPNYKENLRHLAQMQVELSRSKEAIEIYKKLLRRYHDSYLYRELAKLEIDDVAKTALLCQAVVNQRREEFRAKYHVELAVQLMKQEIWGRAAYELQQYVDICKRQNRPLTPYIMRLRQRLYGAKPVERADEEAFYKRSMAYVEQILREPPRK